MVSSRLAERFRIADFAYAHRGLWSVLGPAENSLEALLLAAEMGFGAEFDVRPSADNVPIIFHDPLLDRMTAYKGFVAHYTAKELVGLPLIGGGQVFALETLLSHWPNKTPLLCELKIDGETNAEEFATRAGATLQRSDCMAAAMSFSAEAVAALPVGLMRGQLIQPSEITGESNLVETAIVPVDYFACHISDVSNATLQHARQRRKLVAWTVKDKDTCAALSSITDSQIFEGFDPALAKRHILHR